MTYQRMTCQRAGQAILLLFVLVLIVSGCDDSPAGAVQEDVAVETTAITQSDEFLAIDVQIPTFTGFSATSGKVLVFSDLFVNAIEGVAYVEEKMTERITDSGYFFPGAEAELEKYQGDFPFYINGNQIVVYFSVYELAPYVAGIPFFAFTDAELGDLLRPEIAEAIRGRVSII